MNLPLIGSHIALLFLGICGCTQNDAAPKCMETHDGPWEVLGSPTPRREEMESKLVGMKLPDANRYLGARVPYRYDRDERKVFWYAERRRHYSEFNRKTACAEEMVNQAFLFIEAKLDGNDVIEACSLRTKEFLSRSVITREKAEQSPPGPLDSGVSHCAKTGSRK